jgi:hypothetical protein
MIKSGPSPDPDPKHWEEDVQSSKMNLTSFIEELS